MISLLSPSESSTLPSSAGENSAISSVPSMIIAPPTSTCNVNPFEAHEKHNNSYARVCFELQCTPTRAVGTARTDGHPAETERYSFF